MSKYTYNTFTNLENEGSFIAQLNENFSNLQTLLDTVVSRNGTAPNTLTAALDFNSQNANNIATVRCSTLEINGVEIMSASEAVNVPYGELAADGTAASPALFFTSDVDTGIYRSSENVLAFAAGGAVKATVDTNGLHAIGQITGGTFAFTSGTMTTATATTVNCTTLTVATNATLPAFTAADGTLCTTQSPGDNTTKLASTAFVTAAVAAAVPVVPAVRQYKNTVYTTKIATAVTPSPADGSIPQNTEGTEIFSVSFTPTASDSIIVVSYLGQQAASDYWPVAAIFKDSGADAVSVGSRFTLQTTCPQPISCVYKEVAGSTAARTYKVRVGTQTTSGGAIACVNRGISSSNHFGTGTSITQLEITEYAP